MRRAARNENQGGQAVRVGDPGSDRLVCLRLAVVKPPVDSLGAPELEPTVGLVIWPGVG
jgi:hypothetical protein